MMIQPIEEEEVSEFTNRIKSRKGAENDGIVPELIKRGGDGLENKGNDSCL